jgi:hypothetical protein
MLFQKTVKQQKEKINITVWMLLIEDFISALHKRIYRNSISICYSPAIFRSRSITFKSPRR